MKNRKKRVIKLECSLEIVILLVSLFAFCFIINEASFVSGTKYIISKQGTIVSIPDDQAGFYDNYYNDVPEAQVALDLQKQKNPPGAEKTASKPLPSGTDSTATLFTAAGFAKNLGSASALKWTKVDSINIIDPVKGIVKFEPPAGQELWQKEGITAQYDTKAGTILKGYKLDPKTGASVEDTSITGPAAAAPEEYMFGIKSPFLGSLVGSLSVAIGVAGMVYMLAGLFGMEGDQSKALAVATFIGLEVGQIVGGMGGPGEIGFGLGTWAGIAAGGIAGLIILELMWKKSSKKTVTFSCGVYEPPTGGQYCELCNKDPMRPCSEYRCKSLGQACQLLNAGTGKEACAWVNRNDVTSPTIQPYNEVLTKDHAYTNVNIRPPATGMRIVNNLASDKCIKAFTTLTFGVTTNEPTQCKIDYNHTTTIRDVKQAYTGMAYYFGSSNLYAYNHTETLSLPGTSAINESGGIEIIHDGTFTLYVRCQDANGNINEDEFAIRFCVEKGPDTTPAKIEGTSVGNGMPVRFDTQSLNLEVYTNEPADCKWSRQDKDYELMETEMDCDSSVWDINSNMLYKCLTKLTGIENRKDNEYYFRCRDQPNAALADRNTNAESYKYIVKGSEPLNIIKVSPDNVTIRGFSNVVPVELEVETANGYNKGEATCYYNEANLGRDCSLIKAENYLQMFETNSNKHKQRQDLAGGEYTYCLKCIDLGGNVDFSSVTFDIEIDRNSPAIVRVYNEGGNLKVITDEKSSCSYSQVSNLKCNFEMDKATAMLYTNATEHYTDWKPNTFYYIKCVDESGNQPDPDVCSMTVKPYNQA